MKKQFCVDIDPNLCKGCGVCVEFCRLRVLEMGHARGKQGYLLPVPARPEKCSGCRICELTCPDMAVQVTEAGAVDARGEVSPARLERGSDSV